MHVKAVADSAALHRCFSLLRDTVLGRYFSWPSTRLRTRRFGDAMDKTIRLYLVNAGLAGVERHHREPHPNPLVRRPIWEFEDSDERDRHRSSWTNFPLCVAAIAVCLEAGLRPSAPPTFAEAVEQLAEVEQTALTCARECLFNGGETTGDDRATENR